jgi:hypothetical protein
LRSDMSAVAIPPSKHTNTCAECSTD